VKYTVYIVIMTTIEKLYIFSCQESANKFSCMTAWLLETICEYTIHWVGCHKVDETNS